MGKKGVKLTKVTSLADFEKGTDVYYYNEKPNLNRFATPGSEMAKKEIIKNPQLLVKIGKTDVTANLIDVKVDGFEFNPADRLRTHSGALSAPKVEFAENNVACSALRRRGTSRRMPTSTK